MPDPVVADGAASAAAALRMLERRQEVLANNLANVSTRGFKAETPFARLLDGALAITDTALDQSQGLLSPTRNPLDLAVRGDGFFVVQTPSGERLVRDGTFALDVNRRLVDLHGNPVLADGGPLTLPLGRIDVDATGLVSVNGVSQQRLRLERVAQASALQHEGGTRFVPDSTRVSVPVAQRDIRQGFVEESNVNAMTAMTEMLDVLQRYRSAQTAMSTLESVDDIANALAKPV